MTDLKTRDDDLRDSLSLPTMPQDEGIGETELARQQHQCEPLGLPEVAGFLGLSRATIYQWSFRERHGRSRMPGMPDPDWPSVNGLPAWQKQTIALYVQAHRGWTAEQVAERERLWPEIRATLRSRSGNPWAGDPEKMAKAVESRRANAAAKTAAKAPRAKKAAKRST